MICCSPIVLVESLDVLLEALKVPNFIVLGNCYDSLGYFQRLLDLVINQLFYILDVQRELIAILSNLLLQSFRL